MADTDAEQEVRAVMATMREALNAGDRETVASLLATGAECTMIGTDPEEWSSGDELVAALDQAMTAGGSAVRGVIDETFVHVRGDVAWIEARGRLIDPAGRECACRNTAVLIREDGTWKGVQAHASIGIPNDQIFA
jgi:uncharacterized protein (TIGR02246 family)